MRRNVLWLIAGAVLAPIAAAQEASPDPLRLRLNIPSFRLEAYRDGQLAHRYRVATGDTAFPTPTGSFSISRVEWDPWWVPPRSEWAADESITPPGPANPMGRVKLYFWDLYFVHGTPERNSLGRSSSHGCVRLANGDAIALAKLVHEVASPGLPADTVSAWARIPGRTRSVVLDRPIPLDIVYEVAEVRDDDTLVVYPDVYRRVDGGLADYVLGVLDRAGYDTAFVSRERLEAGLAARSSSTPAAISVAWLMVTRWVPDTASSR